MQSLGEKVRANPLKVVVNFFCPLLHHQWVRPRAAGSLRLKMVWQLNSLFFLAKSLLFVSLQAALGQPLKTSFSGLTESGRIENLPRSGRPKKLTKRERRHIWRTIKRNRKFAREQLHDECAPDVSLATIDRYLRKNGMKWLAKRRPKLTPEGAAKRLK